MQLRLGDLEAGGDDVGNGCFPETSVADVAPVVGEDDPGLVAELQVSRFSVIRVTFVISILTSIFKTIIPSMKQR